MEKKLNLKNDIIFKEFFSRKGNEKFLKDFLNALLQINIEKIEIQRDVSLERLSVEEKLDQWLAFIDNEERGLIELAKEKNEVIKEADEELEFLTGDEEVKRMAFLHEKWEHDYVSGMENAREDGIEQGKETSKREIAKAMKEEKIPIETIIKVTGLTKEEIKKL